MTETVDQMNRVQATTFKARLNNTPYKLEKVAEFYSGGMEYKEFKLGSVRSVRAFSVLCSLRSL